MTQARPESGWFSRTFPVPAPAWIAPAISLALVVGAVGRAQDYLSRDPRIGATAITRGVEVAGFATWGWLFVSVVAATLLGLLALNVAHTRWPMLVAHVWGVGLHVSYVWVLLLEVPGSGRGVGVVLPPFAAAITHLICVGLYVGPRPRKARVFR